MLCNIGEVLNVYVHGDYILETSRMVKK